VPLPFRSEGRFMLHFEFYELQPEAIANSQHYPQAGDAGMSIVNLERGIYKPT
jgi:hypothetical protein